MKAIGNLILTLVLGAVGGVAVTVFGLCKLAKTSLGGVFTLTIPGSTCAPLR
jgi:hypothetical protein